MEAVHVDSRKQFPNATKPAHFYQDGREFMVDNTERQILEQLRKGPLYAASRINLSAYIDRLRWRKRVQITTHWARDPNTGGSYGIYKLTHPVLFLGENPTHPKVPAFAQPTLALTHLPMPPIAPVMHAAH